MGEARKAILFSQLFLTLGTALEVGPVNELPYVAHYATSQPSFFVSLDEPSENYDFTHSLRVSFKSS